MPFTSRAVVLVVGLFAAGGWAAAEEAPDEPSPATDPAAPWPAEAMPVEDAEPAPAPAEEDQERTKQELRAAAKGLRAALLTEFKAWKGEQRASWQAEKEDLRAEYRAEVREVKAWWEQQVAAWKARCAGSEPHGDPAPNQGNNTSAPQPNPPSNGTGNEIGNATLVEHSVVVEPGTSPCGRERAALNHEAHARLKAAREEVREQKRALDEEFRARVDAHIEDLAERLRDALEDKLLDLRASKALDFGAALERRLHDAAAKAREHQAKCREDPSAQGCGMLQDGPRCDATMRCKPPLACEGKIGTTRECTPPPVCRDLGDGTWQCPTPEEMAAQMQEAFAKYGRQAQRGSSS